ncbi:MAG TPA: polymer-forming cytoskeletal protein [Acidobacteriaceae bacterium]
MATTERSLIGKNIVITGDISATEDLVVEGRVTGKIHLNESRLTVGEEGYAQSQISAREVIICGRVEGQIHASERVELRHTAQVTGDIISPRLVIHQDAVIKGTVDLSPSIAIKQQKQAKKDAELQAQMDIAPPRIEPAIAAASQVAVAAPAYAS